MPAYNLQCSGQNGFLLNSEAQTNTLIYNGLNVALRYLKECNNKIDFKDSKDALTSLVSILAGDDSNVYADNAAEALATFKGQSILDGIRTEFDGVFGVQELIKKTIDSDKHASDPKFMLLNVNKIRIGNEIGHVATAKLIAKFICNKVINENLCKELQHDLLENKQIVADGILNKEKIIYNNHKFDLKQIKEAAQIYVNMARNFKQVQSDYDIIHENELLPHTLVIFAVDSTDDQIYPIKLRVKTEYQDVEVPNYIQVVSVKPVQEDDFGLTYRQLRDKLNQIDSEDLLDSNVVIHNSNDFPIQDYILKSIDSNYKLNMDIKQNKPIYPCVMPHDPIENNANDNPQAHQPYITCYDPLRGISYDKPWH